MADILGCHDHFVLASWTLADAIIKLLSKSLGFSAIWKGNVVGSQETVTIMSAAFIKGEL